MSVEPGQIKCDGCGAVVDPHVQPQVKVIDDTGVGEHLHFCGYTCVAVWASAEQLRLDAERSAHLTALVEQTTATLQRAHAVEIKLAEPQDREPYRTVASVPIHPLLVQERDDGDAPFARIKASS